MIATKEISGRSGSAIAVAAATPAEHSGAEAGGIARVSDSAETCNWKAEGATLHRAARDLSEPVTRLPASSPRQALAGFFLGCMSHNLAAAPGGSCRFGRSGAGIRPDRSRPMPRELNAGMLAGDSIMHAVSAWVHGFGTLLHQIDPLRMPGAQATELAYRGVGALYSEPRASMAGARRKSFLGQINDGVEEMLRQCHVLTASDAGKISSGQLLAAAVSYAQRDEQSRLVLVRQIQRIKGHYGGREDEPLLAAHQKSLLQHWVAHNAFGTSIERFVEHKLLSHEAGPGVRPFDGLAIRLHLRNRLALLHAHDPQGQLQEWIWLNVVLHELPVLRYLDIEREALTPTDPEWGQINAGLLYAQSSGLEIRNIPVEEALALGQLLLAQFRAEPQDASAESLHYFRLPALLSLACSHASLMRGRAHRPDYAIESRALNEYLARHAVFLKEHFAPARFQAGLSQYKSRYEMAAQIIQDRCPGMDVNTYLNLGGTFCRLTPHGRADDHPNYLQDIDQLYRDQVSRIAEQFLAVDKLLVLAALGNLDGAELAFLDAAEVVRASAEFSATHQLTYSGLAGANPHARSGLTIRFPRDVEFFSAFQGSVERIYALSQDAQRVYKLTRIDRDVARYHQLLADRRPLRDAEFKLKVRAAGRALKQRGEPQERLLEQIAQQHKKDFARQLYEQGYAKTNLQKASDFAKSLLPFYTCVTAARAGEVEAAAWACGMDVIAVVPVLGSLSNISVKFGQVLATGGLRAMRNAATEVALGHSVRQLMRSGARDLMREVVIPASQTLGNKELSELALASIRAIDPFFETAGVLGKLSAQKVIRLGTQVQEYLPQIKRMLPAMRAAAGRLPPKLQHGLYGTLSGIDGRIPVVRLEGQQYRKQDVYALSCPETGVPFGAKYLRSGTGELSRLPLDAGRRLSNVLAQGLGGKGGPQQGRRWAQQSAAQAAQVRGESQARPGAADAADAETGGARAGPAEPGLQEERHVAAVRIQQAWRGWKNRLEKLKAEAGAGQQYVRTVNFPRDAVDPGARSAAVRGLGMVSYTPVQGTRPTLSRFFREGKVLGAGGEADVLAGPRGYVLRRGHRGSAISAPLIDASRYGDLTSFRGMEVVDGKYQIGRDAGVDLADYLYRERRVLAVGDFQRASQDLRELHLRGLFHLDIKLENMAYRAAAKEGARLSFIDCGGMTDRPQDAMDITFPRAMLAPDGVDWIDPSGRADDEYNFLLVLLSAADVSFGSTLQALAEPATDVVRDQLQRHSSKFVQGYVKAAYRDAVLSFINVPIEQNVLPVPLHDTIDWSAAPDLCSAMQQGDAQAIRVLGQQAMAQAVTPGQRQQLLLADNADSTPGVCWLIWRDNAQAKSAWDELLGRLPADEGGEVVIAINARIAALGLN